MAFQFVLLSVVLFFMLYAKVQTGLIVAGIVTLCGVLLFLKRRHKHGHTHGAFLSIDAYAQKSRLNTWNSGLKIIFSVLCVFACISANSLLIPLFLLSCMTFITVSLGKIPGRYYLALMATPALFILLSCLAIVVEFSPKPIGVLSFSIGGFYLCVTGQNQNLALNTMLRALGAVSCLYMLSLSTPVYRIIEVLRKVRVPAVVIELMYLMYRYLFILLETHQQMTYASASRLGYRNTRIWIKTTLKNALGLMFISLRRTSDMLTAMEARCYDGDIRFSQRQHKINRAQASVSGAVALGVIALKVMEWRM